MTAARATMDPGLNRESRGGERPVVLVVVGHYLPGFRAGGITTCVANVVARLHSDFQFKVISRDRDLGSADPYPDIKYGAWQAVGGAQVYYVPAGRDAARDVRRVVSETPHDMIYFNSFFEPLVVRTHLARKLRLLPRRPALLAPHGEFAWPSLSQKYPKKALFMGIARLTGLYSDVIWHASNAVEAEDIRRWMRVSDTDVRIAHQLPPTIEIDFDDSHSQAYVDQADGIRAFFLSRISPEKNLHLALDILSRVSVKVSFDIIGPIENAAYWSDCQQLIAQLPSNVTARSVGTIAPSELMRTLLRYDLMVFPTSGEAYGQVIAESLTAGTPVLISTETPWRNLEARGLGWDVPLTDTDRFVRVIDEVGAFDHGTRSARRNAVRVSLERLLAESKAVEDVRRLLHDVVATPRVPRL